jgi:hypothetical protein
VDHAKFVRVVQCGRDFFNVVKRPSDIEPALALDDRSEVGAGNVVHDQVVVAGILTDIMDGCDAAVVEPGRDSRLCRESPEENFVDSDARLDDLDCHRTS